MAINGHFGHSGQSEVSENGPNGFPVAKNLGIDTKIKSLRCSEPKLQIWPFWTCPKWPKKTQNGHFGHSCQSEVSENGLNRFSMLKTFGIDTKIKALAPFGPIPPLTLHIGPLCAGGQPRVYKKTSLVKIRQVLPWSNVQQKQGGRTCCKCCIP